MALETEQQPSQRRRAAHSGLPSAKKVKSCVRMFARAGVDSRSEGKEGVGYRTRLGRQRRFGWTRYGEIGLEADHRVIDVVLKTYRSNSYARSATHINIVSKQ